MGRPRSAQRRYIQSIDWSRQPLGRCPDTLIAADLNVSANTVTRARKLRDIVRFRAPNNAGRVSPDLMAHLMSAVGRYRWIPFKELAVAVSDRFSYSLRQIHRALAFLVKTQAFDHTVEGYKRK
jgi:hypothetical protein